LLLVAVVGLGGAVLGISGAPNDATLPVAAKNTLAASSYTETVVEKTPQGTQTDQLVWQAPDRLGGYIQSGNRRSYVYILPSKTGGSVEYQSVTVSASAPTTHLTFYRQASQSAALTDPAQRYLPAALTATHVTKSGSTYTFAQKQNSSQGPVTIRFTYTVTGRYVSQLGLAAEGSSVQLALTSIGTSPPVALPAGAKILTAPVTPSTGG
jgi:hypothetical protein